MRSFSLVMQANGVATKRLTHSSVLCWRCSVCSTCGRLENNHRERKARTSLPVPPNSQRQHMGKTCLPSFLMLADPFAGTPYKHSSLPPTCFDSCPVQTRRTRPRLSHSLSSQHYLSNQLFRILTTHDPTQNTITIISIQQCLRVVPIFPNQVSSTRAIRLLQVSLGRRHYCLVTCLS